jgi:plastocyanin
MASKKYFFAIFVILIFFLSLPLTLSFSQKKPALTGYAQTADSVSIIDFEFSPATITVPVGTTVTWTNDSASGAEHTTTSDVQGTANSWDSGITTKGQTFSHTFTQAGTFTYHCNVHTFMRGTVIVTAAASPTAVPPTAVPPTAVPPTAIPTTSVPSPACLGTPCTSPTTTPLVTPVPTISITPTTEGGNLNLFEFLIYFIILIIQFLSTLL